MIEHALWLSQELHFAVFPLTPGGKVPLPDSHGFKDATTDESQIRKWWSAIPNANIGIATGAASGILVVDVDGADGERSLTEIGPLPSTLEAKTGKGRHLIFENVPGLGITIGQSVIAPHIDHRGDGGYIVAPPSLHPSGGRYEWTQLARPAPLPPAILERLVRRPLPLISLAKGVNGHTLHVANDNAPATLDSVVSPKSLQEHVQALIDAPPGTKHAALVHAAWAHAAAAHEAHEPRATAQPRLLQLLCGALSQNPHSQVESWPSAEKAVVSGLDKAYARPLPARLEPHELEFSEDGLARRFAREFRARAVFVAGQGWHVWNGRCWTMQPGNGVPTELMSEMLTQLHKHLLATDEKDLAALIKQKKTAGTMRSILALATRYMAVNYDAFDRNPFDLSCTNGTIDLRTGVLREHASIDMITRCCSVAYDPRQACPGWLHALMQMQRGDVSAIDYMRILFGSFLYGESVDGFWLMYGNGFDGKTAVLQVLHLVLGNYAGAINPQAVLVSRSSNKPHTSMIGRLHGKRLATIDEFPADCQLDTGAIKAHFGRIATQVQTGMGKDFVDMIPTAKGLGASNHLPRIDEHDHGTVRRFQVIPFDGDLRAQGVVKDDSFPARLVAAEGAGILAWLVSGCVQWLAAHGQLPQCARVDEATAELFAEGDTVGRFLETCERGAVSCTAAELYQAYTTYAQHEGDTVLAKRTFGNRLRERGLRPHKGGKGARMYVGIKPPPGPWASAPTRSN